MFYERMQSEERPFLPVVNDLCTLNPPKRVQSDKNLYRKYLRVPMNYSDTKQYYVKIFNDYYKLYKSNNNFYFIDVPGVVSNVVKEREFFTSILPSYLTIAIYESILWFTSARLKYKLKVEDHVFHPIFDQPQWSYEDYDCRLLLTMYPSTQRDDKTIPISIFND